MGQAKSLASVAGDACALPLISAGNCAAHGAIPALEACGFLPFSCRRGALEHFLIMVGTLLRAKRSNGGVNSLLFFNRKSVF
jgi:hypothetical protein